MASWSERRELSVMSGARKARRNYLVQESMSCSSVASICAVVRNEAADGGERLENKAK